MPTNYKRLVSLYEGRDHNTANDLLTEAFAGGEISPRNIDLGRLFVECFGWDEFQSCRSREQLVRDVYSRALTEAEGAVSTSAFLNITGQIVYSTVLEEYVNEDFVFTKLIPEVATAFLDGEKIAGLTQIGDEIAIRNESDPYALAGFGEDWIFTPPVRDRGMIVPLTWEAIFADRTGKFLDRARDVGKWSGINREKRAINCFIDENTTAHRYNWRGTTIASYGDNSGTHSWDNLAASNTLVDWTSLNTAEQVSNTITDPFTGEPTLWELRHLVVTKQNEQTARRIVRQGEIRVTSPGYATTGNPSQHVGENPYSTKYEVVTSRLLAAQLATDTDWWIANIPEYACYMQAEKMQVMQAPSNSHEEFHRRIVQQFRVSERGAYVVRQPRASIKSTVA